MEHDHPLVTWKLFGFDIIFDLSSILMMVITALIVLLSQSYVLVI